MNTRFLLGAAILLATFFFSGLYAQNSIRSLDRNNNGIYEEGEVDPCQEYVTGKATCTYPVTRFKKCTYCTKKDVCEPYIVEKPCCRYVNQYFTKYHSRKVTQYYPVTYCRKVPENFCIKETRYRKRCVTQEHCYYQPITYYKTTCCETPDECPCPQ